MMTYTMPAFPGYSEAQQARFDLIESLYAGQQPDVVIIGCSFAAPLYWPEAQWSGFGSLVANMAIGATFVEHVYWQVANTAIDLSQVRHFFSISSYNNIASKKDDPYAVASYARDLAQRLKNIAPASEVHEYLLWPYVPPEMTTYNARLQQLAAATGKFDCVGAGIPWAYLDDPANRIVTNHPAPNIFEQYITPAAQAKLDE